MMSSGSNGVESASEAESRGTWAWRRSASEARWLAEIRNSGNCSTNDHDGVQHRIHQHLPVQKAQGRVEQVAPEQFTEGETVGDPEEAERTHHQMYIHRIDIRAEHAVPLAPVEDALQDDNDTAVQIMNDL